MSDRLLFIRLPSSVVRPLRHMPLPQFDYRRMAWAYDLVVFPLEYARYRKIRPQLFRGLSGRILDAGVGTGRNFPFYPPGSAVVGIDLSPAMLARAHRRRAAAAAPVELRQMDVTRLDFPDGSFDAAVAALLFSTLPDDLQIAARRELRRVLKPGGIIRCLEYARQRDGLLRPCRIVEFPQTPP
jgi:ubiquinone/menaquinone biosynthesis C-methylase UbiE